MRVTTQMMHASAKRAGIPLGEASLLNYINKGNTPTTQSILLNALNTKQNTTISKTQSANYKKLEESANSLLQSVERFMEEGENSIYQSVDTQKSTVADAVKQLVKGYNNTVKHLKTTSNPLNDFYREMLAETAKESENDLFAIGITQNENGMLALDEEKLSSADIETIKKALDGNGLFTTKTAYIVSRISDNAKTNVQSYSSQYGSDGYSYLANSSRYDFWG